MRKEIVWTSIIGISFGLVIAFGLYRINYSFKTKVNSTQIDPTPRPVNSEFNITLNKPNNNDVITQNTVAVSGITKPLSWLVVSGEDSDYIIQTDNGGAFSQDVDLISGINQIKITAFDPQANQSIQKVLVVYSSSFQVKIVPTPTSDSSTESAIRQKVAQDIANALNQPKAYIGIVTDISDSTIQIKTDAGEIKQISTNNDGITVIDTNPTTKIVKLTDIAIGDFVVAMGYVNSKSVLDAQRILITDPISESKIDSSLSKVTGTSKKNLTVAGLRDGNTTTITPTSKTNIETYASGKVSASKLTNISQDDLVIYVNDNSGTQATTRSIFVVNP